MRQNRPTRSLRATRRPLALLPALLPVVAALAAAMPLASLAQPAPNAVPVPATGWRVQGSGSTTAPVNKPNAEGGIDQWIYQSSTKAIYNWQTFNIGEKSSVTFDMAQPGSSALNRVLDTAPSQIFGKLSATHGGEIYLINQNGILFGRTAQVNTGSLIASALNIKDEEYLSGLTHSLIYNPGTPTFAYDGDPTRFVDANNFVRVDEGAVITTGNGGRVFLFAKKVENAGTITTPGGQTLMAAGGAAYLYQPTAGYPLYTLEDNPQVPLLRGLLVEVGSSQQSALAPGGDTGSVTNLGQINTPRGNTTMVGMAVNQFGRISATSSVAENGSVILRAQGGTGASLTSPTPLTAGLLQLGDATHASEITLTADAQLGPDGQPLTSDGNANWVPPTIKLFGANVVMAGGSRIVAPGANVDIRASSNPQAMFTTGGGQIDPTTDTGRIVIGDGAVIDVAGTTTATAGVDRYFVTTGLLGSNDLKDAPLQKDGILYRSKVTVDVRGDSPILGDLGSYRNGIQTGIDERLSAGGNVDLFAGSGVLMHAGARIDVSGGQVTLTGASVQPTSLVAEDGRVFDINHAPADLRYVAAINLQRSGAEFDRWGVKVNYGVVAPAREEAGYVEGRAAGTLNVLAPSTVLAGRLDAHTAEGERQRQGVDAAPAGGVLNVGLARFSSLDQFSAVAADFTVAAQAPEVDAAVWAEPLSAALPAHGGMAHATLADSGFTHITLAAHDSVTLSGDGASLDLGPQGSLTLLAGGQWAAPDGTSRATLDGAVHSAGGSVTLRAREVTMTSQAQVDLAGAFVNTLEDGPSDTGAIHGGRFTARGDNALTMAAGSVVDVRGGGAVGADGKLTGGDGGAVALSTTNPFTTPTLVLDGALHGDALGAGATLAMQLANDVVVGGTEPLADGVIRVDPGFFTQGGFGGYSVSGGSLTVAEGTTLAPERASWHVDPNAARRAATGSSLWALAEPGLLPGQLPAAASLSLAATGDARVAGQGVLTMGEGTAINAPALSSVSLTASHQLLMDGAIHAEGGKVSLRTTGNDEIAPSLLWVGEHAAIDVSGGFTPLPTTNGLLAGRVTAGGSISIDTSSNGANNKANHLLVVQEGAQLAARGATGTVDRTELTANGPVPVRRELTSAGGSVALASGSGLVAEGQMDVSAAAGAPGGRVSVTVDAALNVSDAPYSAVARSLHLTDDSAPSLTAGLALGDRDALAALTATDFGQIRSSTLAASQAADVALTGRDALQFDAGSSLAVPGRLTLTSAALVLPHDQTVALHADVLRLASIATASTAAPATEGLATLVLQADDGVQISGHWATQGVADLQIAAQGDVMLDGSGAGPSGRASGALRTAGELTLAARQIYPATAVDFTLAAGPDAALTLARSGADALPLAPLSAAGSVTLQAATIVQGGVLRAPQGQLNLEARDRLTLARGSETSVSGAGQMLPFGIDARDDAWLLSYAMPLESLPTKAIHLTAPAVDAQSGATVDASGGGDLVAYQFVAGRGGSTDVFAGGDGAYALVPGVHQAAAWDATQNGAAALGQQIEIGAGAPIAAGIYTLLPARYALQPGAVLVKPVAGSPMPPLAMGMSVAQTDGSVWVGAALRAPGQDASSPPTTWSMMTTDVARTHSEIRTLSGNAWIEQQAALNRTPTAARPVDGGALTLATTSATLDAALKLGGARDAEGHALGLGGVAAFSAGTIRIDADSAATAADGVLQLRASTVNAMQAQTLILGAAPSDTDPSRLTATAEQVHIDTGNETLLVSDLIATAKGALTVADGTHITALAAPAGSDPLRAIYTVAGDGAGLRISGQSGASLNRAEVPGASTATLALGEAVALNAAGGSLTLESSQRTQLADSAQLQAATLTLGAREVAIGMLADAPDALTLSPALLTQAGAASTLTLRGYERVAFADGSHLGASVSAGGTPTLGTLVLDAPLLDASAATVAGAAVSAQQIVLTNTSGQPAKAAQDAPATPEAAPAGTLTLHAVATDGNNEGSGLIALSTGAVAVRAQTTTLDAGGGLRIGQGALRVAGDLTLDTPTLQGAAPGTTGVLAASGALTANNSHASAAEPSRAADGAAVSVSAHSIVWNTALEMPSGDIALTSATDLTLGAQAQLSSAGRVAAIGPVAVDQRGGRVQLTASAGTLDLQAGSRVDVSGAGLAPGGSLALAAPQGTLHAAGALAGHSGGMQGASLSVDVGAALDVAAIASQQADASQFAGELSLRQREGDLLLPAGTALHGERVTVSADGGALTVAGQITATAADGGRITLGAGGDLTLAAGSQVRTVTTAANGDGGRVGLYTQAGEIAVQAGSQIDTSGQGTGLDGKLLLRAAQVLGDDGQLDVAIAPLAGQISGARQIDIEAFKLYDGVRGLTAPWTSIDGYVPLDQLEADAQQLIGWDGSGANRIAERLAAGQADVDARLRVHAGAELRGGALRIGEPWGTDNSQLVVQSQRLNVAAMGYDATHVGDLALTLRAETNVTVNRGLSGSIGYLTAPDAFSAESSAAGDVRLVAGADMHAALPTTTGSRAGTLAFANTNRNDYHTPTIMTTTGDLTLAASADIVLPRTSEPALVSFGLASSDPALAAYIEAVPEAKYRFGAGMREGGGDIRLQAGRHIVGTVQRSNAYGGADSDPSPGDWTDMHADGAFYIYAPDGTLETVAAPYWQGTFYTPASGVTQFGGGHVTARAGGDVRNLTIAAPSAGFFDEDGMVHEYGHANVDVSAGRDINNGVFQASGSELRVSAGRDIVNAREPQATQYGGMQLYYGNTATEVYARRHLTLGTADSGLHVGAPNSSMRDWITGLDADASLTVTAAGGRVALQMSESNSGLSASDALPVSLLPSLVRLASPNGDVTLGIATTPGPNYAVASAPWIQVAQSTAPRLDVLAAGSLSAQPNTTMSVAASRIGAPTAIPGLERDAALGIDAGSGSVNLLRATAGALDGTDRAPVRLVAAGGSATLPTLLSARPIEVHAALDVLLTDASRIDIQHQPRADGVVAPSDLSLIQAGGDIRLGNAAVRVGGPGDLVLLAGRDINVGTREGIQSTGNLDNSTLLPHESASVTLVAGLRADGADYLQATQRGFGAVGHATLTGHAGDVYALLSAGGTAAPGLGSAAAQAFNAQDTAGQLASVRTLLGASYDAALARYVRSLPGHTADSDAEALAAFGTLSPVKQAAAPGALLAESFGAAPADTRLPFLTTLAAAGSDHGAGLIGFMQQQTGQTLALEGALAAFEALPLERQVLRLNAMLVDEVRTQGRAAVAARLADDKEAAYDRAYAAINSLFPLDEALDEALGGRPAGNLALPQTQIRTLQGGAITMMVPGGSLNAGEARASKPANELGIVTVGGGDISAVARDDILVNQSRIFTLAEGDILLWSSTGDVDAGRGAKTVTAAPPPTYYLDENGKLVVDTSGSFSGSGIAALDARSALDLFAPTGAIDAGEAGIRALGTVTLGAQVVRGADDIVGGSVVGAPPPPPTTGATAGLAAAAAAAQTHTQNGDDDEERRRKRRARRNLLLEFLGFGRS